LFPAAEVKLLSGSVVVRREAGRVPDPDRRVPDWQGEPEIETPRTFANSDDFSTSLRITTDQRWPFIVDVAQRRAHVQHDRSPTTV
jgi:hypothetical protein